MSRLSLLPAALIAAAVIIGPIRDARAAGPADPAQERVLSIFTNGLGQVWERRAMKLPATSGRVVLPRLSHQAVIESVRITGDGGPVMVEDVAFDQALLTPAALLKRYLGREIGIIKAHPTTGEERIVKGTVVSLAGGVVLRVDGRLETGMPDRLSFPDETFGLPPEPVLAATLSGGSARGVVLTYLTDGLDWSVDYTAQLAPSGDRLSLTGWASIQNNTGVALDAQRLRLVAGQVNRTSGGGHRPMPKAARMMTAEAAPAADAMALPSRQAVGQVHVYTVARAVDLPNGIRKQVALVQAADIKVKETLISAGHPVVFGPHRGEPAPSHPTVRLSFDNKALIPSGLPLPAGIVRVYRPAPDGPALFAGEDRMADTPDGETAKLTLGQAFDVTVRRKQTDFKRLDAKGRNVEAAFEIEFRNGRDKDASVRVDENLPADWIITEESAKHARTGSQARWTVVVPANGKTVLTYRVEVKR